MGLKTLSAVALSTLALVACDPKPGKPTTTSDAASTMPAAPQQNAMTPPVGQPVPQNYAAAPAVAGAPNDGVPPPNYVAPPTHVAQAQVVQPRPAPQAAPNPALHGEVRAIEAIRDRPQGTGKGAIIGGVLGAVVGNRFGHGNGRAAMTVLGGAGGAVAGNNVERNMNEGVVGYRVSVQLDNGQHRTYEQQTLDGLQIGDRVRLDHGRIRRS